MTHRWNLGPDARVDLSGSGLVGQAERLEEPQAERLVAEWDMRIRRPSRRGSGRLVASVAENASRVRVRDQREGAPSRVRQAIGKGAAEQEFEDLLDAGHQAIGQAASTWSLPVGDLADGDTFESTRDASELMFELAALASVGAAVINDEDFSTLYGPWWRAVVRNVRPVWATRWSPFSLAGCWLAVIGVALAPFANEGEAGYATLGIIVFGSILWGVSAMRSTATSDLWPEPSRSSGSVAATSSRAVLRRMWRAPEAIVWKIVRFSQLR